MPYVPIGKKERKSKVSQASEEVIDLFSISNSFIGNTLTQFNGM
jgi:hypothetical protein